jgi:[ribosomal protein S5]-alanine N-acetyltransferase
MKTKATITLVAIEQDGRPRGYAGALDEDVVDALGATADFYRAIGFREPWISYLALAGSTPVGICSFKSAPVEGRVEIGYFTFPGYEGQGVATSMATALVARAAAEGGGVLITAQTQCERGASHRVLEKIGFRPAGTIDHPEDGTVLEWYLTAVHGS